MVNETRLSGVKFTKKMLALNKKHSHPNLSLVIAEAVKSQALAPRFYNMPTNMKRAISWECAECIQRHLHLFSSVYHTLLTAGKFKNFVVGLMFLMRKGMVVYDIQVLPHIKLLNYAMPKELYLKRHFDISGKTLTETENVIKMTMRSVSTDNQVFRNFCDLVPT
jgi:hypothetical protein